MNRRSLPWWVRRAVTRLVIAHPRGTVRTRTACCWWAHFGPDAAALAVAALVVAGAGRGRRAVAGTALAGCAAAFDVVSLRWHEAIGTGPAPDGCPWCADNGDDGPDDEEPQPEPPDPYGAALGISPDEPIPYDLVDPAFDASGDAEADPYWPHVRRALVRFEKTTAAAAEDPDADEACLMNAYRDAMVHVAISGLTATEALRRFHDEQANGRNGGAL